MASDIPKQYLMLKSQRVIEHTVDRLLSIAQIEKIVVVIAQHDEVWSALGVAKNPRVTSAVGGIERCHSVLNGLVALPKSSDGSWVLVHDAARPCVRPQDIAAMVERLKEHPVGGILGAPVRDTLKKSDADNQIVETLDRTSLWHAFTPQMFRVETLRDALEKVIDKQGVVTDEAQAIEQCGLTPELVEGHSDNLKITQPADLVLAGLYLDNQKTSGVF